MSTPPPEIQYASQFADLGKLLSEIRTSREFCVHGSWITPPPWIQHQQAGSLSLPVFEPQLKNWIKIAEKAPFGRGAKTVLDTKIRNVWQLDVKDFSVSGVGWITGFEELLKNVQTRLCGDNLEIEAQLYKLLIYEKGGFFKPHRDTEKDEKMFGTLVVSLASDHEGGDLLVRHAGQQEQVSLQVSDPGTIQYAAFFADCEHEVQPIKKGNRVCLVYNLCYKKKSKAAPLTAPDYSKEISQAKKILSRLKTPEGKSEKLIYFLDHMYSEKGLSIESLKGRDAGVFQVLKHAAKTAELNLYLGIVHIKESGIAEEDYGYDDYESNYSDDDYEILEVFDETHEVDILLDSAGTPTKLGCIKINDGECLPVDALKNTKPDSSNYYGATGNEGASFDRAYLRAAIVIWPDEKYNDICINNGPDSAIGRLKELGRAVRKSRGPAKVNARKIFTEFAKSAIQSWSRKVKELGEANSYYDDYKPKILNSEQLQNALNTFNLVRDEKLTLQLLKETLPDHYISKLNPLLAECCEYLDPYKIEPFLDELMCQKTHKGFPFDMMDLWARIANSIPDYPILNSLLRFLLKTMDDYKMEDLPPVPRFRWIPQAMKDISDGQVEGFQPEIVIEFLSAIQNSNTADSIPAALQSITGNTLLFPGDKILFPVLEKSEAFPLEMHVKEKLWNACVQFYLNRSQLPPPEPTDWKVDFQPDERDKNDPVIKQLKKFALDPKNQKWEIAIAQAGRRTIENAILMYQLPMTHETIRKGSPYKLVCCKTRDPYHREMQQYDKDISELKSLIQLPAANQHSNAKLKKLVQKAIE